MTSEAEESIMKEMNSSRREIVSENNGILKPTASESYSKEVNDTEREDSSIWEKETITKITSVDQLDKMHSSRDESKREIKNPGKNVVITTGKPCMRQRPFCNIVGNQEQRRDELEKMEDDLRKRLDILECSMPAVMVWNILKMSQGAPVCSIGRILEKQLKRAKEISCRSTPSCHYDCRVREIEAERKLALKKTEEARTLWLEKLATLEKRKKELEKARRIQEEQRNAMDRLNEEAKALREAKEKKEMEVNESCHGECGDIECQKLLGRVSSVTSIESEDIQCLEKLQQLAEDEVIIKRGIAELERREEAYMKTLQQADELWSKMEGDGICTTSALQEQLDIKTAANQQLAARVCELEDALENCQAKLAACRTELEKCLSLEKLEAMIGREDDVAEVIDRAVAVKPRVVHRPIGREDDVAIVKDDEVLARVEVVDEEALAEVEIIDEEVLAVVEVIDEEALAKVEVMDEEALAKVEIVDEEALVKVEAVDEEILAELEAVDEKLAIVEVMDEEILARVELADLAIDRPVDLVPIEDVESIVRPEDIINDQLQAKKVREYLAKLGSLEELYKEGEPCDPEFVCNDVVTSPTGMTDEELIALGIDPKTLDKKLVVREEEDRIFPEELVKDVIEDVEVKEPSLVINSKEEIAEAIDVPVREIVPRPIIPEEVADDKLVTIPIDVRALEIEKIKIDQDIVIPRDTILSWIDMIDTIRTSAAKHPDCYEVKKDADVLIKLVGAHVGIKPKEIEEKKIITEDKREEVIEENEIKIKPEEVEEKKIIISAEDKREEVIEENEIKVNESVIIETKLPDELIVPTIRKLEPPTKNESIPLIPSLPLEEIPVEVKAPTESIAELQPTKEEISVDVEPPTTVSIENSFEYPTIPVKEDLLVPNSKPVPYEIEIEKIEIEEAEEEIVKEAEEEIVKEAEEEIVKEAEEEVVKEAEEEIVKEAEEEIVKEAEEEIVKEAEEEIVKEIVDITKEAEIPQVDKVEENAVIEDLIDKELAIEKVINDKIMEPTEEEQILIAEEIEKKEEEIVPEEVKRDEEEVEDVPVKEVIENEKAVEEKVDERLPVSEEIDESKYVEDVEVIPEIVSPTVDLMEVEKIERELLIVDAEEVPTDIVSEKITIKESLPSAKEPSITDVIPEEIKKVPTKEDIREIIEEKEEIEAIEDIETIIQPSVPEAEIKKEISEEMPDVVTPSIKLFEKIEEEEMPVEEEKIAAKIALPMKEEKKIELIDAELKIETKPTEVEIPIIPIDPRLLIQPYLIIAKIKERELMQAAPTMKLPCAECCLQQPSSARQTAEMVKIMQTSVAQTEVMQAKIVDNEIVETDIIEAEMVETELVEITTQTISVEPPRMPTPIISEYIKPAEMKASYTKFTDDRPEITGRKMPVEPPRMPTPVISEYIKPAEMKASYTKFTDDRPEITGRKMPVEPPRMPTPIISKYIKPAEMKAPYTKFTDDRSEITGQKMPSYKRLKDQSTVTTNSAGSQTDKTSRVSHDRVVRDERARGMTADELLRSIKIAAKLARPDAEREIRTINYGGRSDEMGGKVTCNCCQCGKISTPPSTRPRMKVQPQIDAVKTATPPAAAFKRTFIPPKIDRPISYDRLCPDCIAKIQGKMLREKYHIEKTSRDQASCGCASIDKPCCTVPRRREIEKKDQGSLAKMPKRKTNFVEQKRKDDLQSISEDPEKIDIEPLSPSCICYKSEKISPGPIRKGNCYCGD